MLMVAFLRLKPVDLILCFDLFPDPFQLIMRIGCTSHVYKVESTNEVRRRSLVPRRHPLPGPLLLLLLLRLAPFRRPQRTFVLAPRSSGGRRLLFLELLLGSRRRSPLARPQRSLPLASCAGGVSHGKCLLLLLVVLAALLRVLRCPARCRRHYAPLPPVALPARLHLTLALRG
jgi:hypothetical protein